MRAGLTDLSNLILRARVDTRIDAVPLFLGGRSQAQKYKLGSQKARTVNVLREMRSPFVQIHQRLFVIAAQMRRSSHRPTTLFAAFAGPR